MRREGRRAGPQAEDGTCAQETERHPPGLEKTATRVTVTLLTKQHQRVTYQSYNSSHLLLCQWSRDCRTATQQASVAPVAEERGPEGMAAGSAAAWAASSQHPEHQLPAPSAWTRSAAAPGGETRSSPECHSTSEE